MERHSLDQPAPSRAWEDTKEWVIGNTFWAWLIVAILLVVGGAVLGVIWPRIVNGIYGALSGIGVLALLILITYAVHLILALKRQRNEARNEVKELKKRITEMEQPKPQAISIEIHSASLFGGTASFAGLSVDCTLRPNRDHLQLVDIKLCVGPNETDCFSPMNFQIEELPEVSLLEFPFFMENKSGQRYKAIRFLALGTALLRQHPTDMVYKGHLHVITGEGEFDSPEFTIKTPTSHKVGISVKSATCSG